MKQIDLNSTAILGGTNKEPIRPTAAEFAVERRLFPLHLTPFENYMLHDDSPQFPMTFILQFEFTGCIDRDTFQNAVDRALVRQPMLRSHIRPAKGGRNCWVATEAYNSEVLWDDWAAPINQPVDTDFIDLKNEIGFRCWGRHDEKRARCVFLFHHAAVDGLAAYQFVGDILWFYATDIGDELEPLPEVNPAELRNRLRNNLSPEILQPSSAEQRKLAIDRIEQPVQVLASPAASFAAIGEGNFPDIFTLDFDKEQFRQLRLVAQDRGQSVNDALLESLFVALVQWNQVFSDDTQAGKICINMPLDLRNDAQPQYLAANYVSYALVHRASEEIAEPTFAGQLRMELAHLKHTRFNSDFMRFLVETPVDNNDHISVLRVNTDCLATVVFSNTGDPTRRFWVKLPRCGDGLKCGNLVLADVLGSPPLRKGTRAAVGVLTYQRKLRLCIRSDRNFMNAAQSKLFLDHFAELFVTNEYHEMSSVLLNVMKTNRKTLS
ncbi:MAG: chromosome condensation protein [Pirellulaceae bacterium]|nr:chromosome condensation protein [Pirellulaceae bacterium]